MTRDQKFQKCFNDYMLNINIDDIDYSFSYNLQNLTENKTRCEHKYLLTIYGNMETEYSTGENVSTVLPTCSQFIEHMRYYFDPYEKISSNGMTKLSYIDYVSEPVDDVIATINFNIIYDKDHLPFPKLLTQEDKYILEIEKLSELVEIHHRTKTIFRRKYNNAMIKLKKVQEKIQEKISNNYENNEDCPVCYEEIEKNNLFVPLCFHNICISCYERCDKCPLCRGIYV